jgi:KDO2-lipid IV(A) lauroyltransferase
VEPPELAEWFVGLRASLGIEVVPLDSKAGTAYTRALGANRVLALLCDRDVAGGGVEVEFFGERTTLPAGPATLALRTGAPLVPATIYFTESGGHHGIARPPLDTTRRGKLREDVARITQDLAHELEDLIRQAPEQWHLLQPNWPSDRSGGD